MSGLNTSRGIGDGRAQVWSFEPVLRFAYGIQQQEEGKRRLAQKQFEELSATYDPKRAKLRSADVPEYVEKYKLFADAKRALVSGKVKDPIEIARLNDLADKAAGEMQQLAAMSQETVEGLKMGLQGYMSNSDNFDTNYPLIAGAANQTPSRLLKEGQLIGVDPKTNPYSGVDLTNPSSFLNKQPDVKDFKDFLPTEKFTETVGVSKDGKGYNQKVTTLRLQDDIQTTLNKFDNYAKTKPSAQKYFAKIVLEDKSNGNYKKVVEWAKTNAKGVNVDTPAKYFALRERMNYQPQVVEKGELQFSDDQKFANQQSLMRDRAALENYYKKKYGEEQDVWVEGYIDEITPKENKSTGEFFGNTNNQIEIDPVVMSALNYPDKFSYNPNKNTYYVTYYKKDKDGINILDEKTGEPILKRDPLTLSRSQLKLAIRKAAPKDVQTVREMTGNKNAGTKSGTVESSKKYKYKGKSITEEAVKKAAEASGLTVDEYIRAAGIEQ